MNNFITRINALQAKPEFLNENNEDKEKALYAKGWNACNKEYINNLRDIPTENVRPVEEGVWIIHVSDLFPADSTIECNQCHAQQSIWIDDDNFCPNCGAKMVDAVE